MLKWSNCNKLITSPLHLISDNKKAPVITGALCPRLDSNQHTLSGATTSK